MNEFNWSVLNAQVANNTIHKQEPNGKQNICR